MERLRLFGAPPQWDDRHIQTPNTSENASIIVPLGRPNWPAAPPPQINTLYWPSGAARWAHMVVLVDDDGLQDVYETTRTNATSGSQNPEAAPLVLKGDAFDGTLSDGWSIDEHDQIALQVQMYHLAPVPVSTPDTEDKRLYLLPLVDDRYWWQWMETTPATAAGTWDAMFTQFADRLGVEWTQSDIDTAYVDSCPEIFSDTEGVAQSLEDMNVAVAIDCAAMSVGQRFVRDFDGECYLNNADDAAFTFDGNIENARVNTFSHWQRIAGGDTQRIDKSGDEYPVADTAVPVPSQVQVIHRLLSEQSTDGTTLRARENGYLFWAADTKVQIRVPYEIDTAQHRIDLFDKIAEDFYDWHSRYVNECYAGIKAWKMTGFEDCVTIEMGSPGRCGSPHEAQTRIISLPSNFVLATHLGASEGAGDCECPEIDEYTLAGATTGGTVDITLTTPAADEESDPIEETLTFNWNETAATFKTELITHPGIEDDDVEVYGGPWPSIAIYVRYKANLANKAIPFPEITDNLTGTGAGANMRKFSSYDATGHIVANWGIDEPAIITGQTLTTWAVGVDTTNRQCWDINTVDSSMDPRRGSRLNNPPGRLALLDELTDDFDGDASPHDDFWYVDMQTSGFRICPACVATASYAWAWYRLAPQNLPEDTAQGFALTAWAADGTLQGSLQPVWEIYYYDTGGFRTGVEEWVSETIPMYGGTMVLNGDSVMVVGQDEEHVDYPGWGSPDMIGPTTVSSTPDQPDVPRIWYYTAEHSTKPDRGVTTHKYRVGCWATQDEAGFVACDTTPFAEYGATADAEHEDWEVQYPSDDVNLWPRVEWANAWYYLDSSGAVVKTWDTGNDYPANGNSDYGEIVMDDAALYSARANAANGNIILKVDNTTRNILKSADGSRQNITLAGTPLAECVWDQYYYAANTHVKAYSLADGTLQWTCNLTNWGAWGSQPVLMIADANFVYVTTVKTLTSPSRRSRGVVAIKASDGSVAWERRKIPDGGARPMAQTIDAGRIITAGTVGRTLLSDNLNLQHTQFAQRALRPFSIDLFVGMTHDAIRTQLPASAGTDDLGYIPGTFGTSSPTIQTGDLASAGSTTRKARFRTRLPHEYEDGETVQIRVYAGMDTNIADNAATVDIVCYEDDGEGGISADLCATAAQSANSATFANLDFAITATGLVAGSMLDFRIDFLVNDGATGSGVIGVIGALQLLCDCRG
ncbi:Uncharacterized protein SCF082_LOCUS47139 [Durusdinium trenchii]|uniref:Tip attachment protein J domain-containing protein n=1 Tax=Durusdinium trenchii TaxID=1381693 RepID=A0ABP0RK84_9DINO